MYKKSKYNYDSHGLIQAWRMLVFAAVISVIMIFSGQSAQAASAERIVENPPLLELRNQPAPKISPLTQPLTRSNRKAEKVFELDIKYTEGQLYNPKTQRYDRVRLRSYVGTHTSQKRPFVAPTIDVKPGDTVRIKLNNQLPANDLSCNKEGDENTPHCFNRSNLHSHGLWVSPTGNSDNVLTSINPKVSFQYEYNIPPEHPAGTFWYHPHVHGSTALQVSSGMAGAFIVRGNRLPSESANGDIDTLLQEANIKERILVLQQIQYACGQDNQGNVRWDCDTNQIGEIESYKGFNPNLPTTWSKSGRYTSINGEILPKFTAANSGRIERWRIIHAGVRDTINLQFIKRKEGAPSIKNLKATDADAYIKNYCQNKPIQYHVFADDGLTRSQAWQTNLTTLQPGYRSDALVVFPEPGNYCVVDASTPASGSVSGNAESGRLLGIVNSNGEKLISYFDEETQQYDIHRYLKEQLVAAAKVQFKDTQIQSKVVSDLEDDLKLTAFTPHYTIQDSEVTGKQELTFYIDTQKQPTKFEVSNDIGANFQPKPYDPNHIDRHLTLGSVDEWTLQSRFVSHPFHIHVNPFQIVKILDQNGKDVSLPDVIDNANGQIDPQYQGLKGVWKDTLWVKSLIPNSQNTGIYTIVVRTLYQRYIGEFVLHCHILDHEDQGMMQNVSIVIPKSADNN